MMAAANLKSDMTAVVKVGDRTITANEIVPLLKQYGMLSALVREIVIDQAIADLTLTPEETLRACQQFYLQHQINSEEDLEKWLLSRGLYREQLEEQVTRNTKLEIFKQKTWGNKLESYFLQRKAKLDRVVYSLIRVSDLGTAQELYFRIHEKEHSFSELAREYSQGPEAQTGGVLGPMELSVPHPQLTKMLVTSQPGQLSPPTRFGEWVVIVRLEKLIPAQLDLFMQKRLLNELFENWLQKYTQSHSVVETDKE